MRSLSRFVVLSYHHVGPEPTGVPPGYSIPAAAFSRHMQWLRDAGFRGLTLAQCQAIVSGAAHAPPRAVLLTFDDGFADLCRHALPVIAEQGWPAVVFCVSGHVGGDNRWDHPRDPPAPLMTAAEMREWSARGIDFGAHSRTHVDLTRLDDEGLASEVEGSRDDLEAILGTRVGAFAYPYGAHDARVRDCVQRAYPLAFTCEIGSNGAGTDPMSIRRVGMDGEDTPRQVRWKARWGWEPRGLIGRVSRAAGRLIR